MGEKEKGMSKYKNVLVSQIQERKKNEKIQNELKQKHGIGQDENVVVVEKNTTVKFMITTVGTLVRYVAQIGIIILATIGLITLIYPELREPFLKLLSATKTEFFSFFVK